MGHTSPAPLSHHDEEQLHHSGSRAVALSRRLLRRPTMAVECTPFQLLTLGT